MIRATFSGLNTARLALMASQNGLDVTGQNIANVKTEGYTRQKLDQVSFGNANLQFYPNVPDAHIGFGVRVTGVSQYRDDFLDVRYRDAMASVGTYDRKVSIMNKLESILGETSNEALAANLSDLNSSLQKYQNYAGQDAFDNLVRSSAQKVTQTLNQYAKQLANQKDNMIEDMNNDAKSFNDLLTKIRDLNISIKNSQITGNSALELQDERNQLLDALSTYGELEITYETKNLASGSQYETLKVDLVTDSGKITLLDDNQPAKQLAVEVDKNSGNVSVYDASDSAKTPIKFTEGTFKSSISMVNDSGPLGNPPSTTNGIGYYQKMLDSFAQKFAETFNKTNTDLKDAHTASGSSTGIYGSDLFTATGGSGITAANISVSDDWLKGTTRLNCNDSTEALQFISVLTDDQTFEKDGITTYKGSFQECIENFRNILATDIKSETTILKNQVSIVNDISDSKDSVSGVNLDEETMNMMSYNKSFSAAARLVTSLDQMLDTLLSMGVVGR